MSSKHNFGTVLIKLITQMGIPAIIAALYTVWAVGIQGEGKTLIATFATSFFFIMWFAGQYYRTLKQVKDEYNHETQVSEISRLANQQEAQLSEISRIAEFIERTINSPLTQEQASPEIPQQAMPIPSTESAETPSSYLVMEKSKSSYIDALLIEAEGASEIGSAERALLVLSVAFERSIRKYAQVNNIYQEQRESFSSLLNRVETSLGNNYNLKKLWQIRNTVVHGQVKTDYNSEEFAELIRTFRSVITHLDLLSRKKFTGDPCPRCGDLTMGSGGWENVCGKCGFTGDQD